MPNAIHVRPGRWTDITILYDDGQYSAIYGTFTAVEQPPRRALGVRWNGAPGTKGCNGYPIGSGHPVWYVEANFLIVPVLYGLRQKLIAQAPSPRSMQDFNYYLANSYQGDFILVFY